MSGDLILMLFLKGRDCRNFFVLHLDGFLDKPLAGLTGFSGSCYVCGQTECGSAMLPCLVPKWSMVYRKMGM